MKKLTPYQLRTQIDLLSKKELFDLKEYINHKLIDKNVIKQKEIGARAYNALRANGIKCYSHLENYKENTLLKMSGIGRATIDWIKIQMDNRNIHLMPEEYNI